MWSSAAGETNDRHSNICSTKISHSSSSSSPVTIIPIRKSMEEVWKEINLATLGHDSRPATPSLSLEAPVHNKAAAADAMAGRHALRGMILQDFLADAFKDPLSCAAGGDLPQLSLPPTALSLCSSSVIGPGFDYQGFRPGPPNSNSDSSCPGGGGGNNGFSAASGLFSSKNRLVDAPSPCISGGDRHHKRMIKNRESAARSRARKQAYTNELELEVAQLAKENTMLKKQNEELRLAMTAQLPKRKALQRTSSAPF